MARFQAVTAILIFALWMAGCGGGPQPTPASMPATDLTATAVADVPLEPTPASVVGRTPEATAEPTPSAVAIPTATGAADAPVTAGRAMTFVMVGETTVRYAIDEVFLNENNRLATAVGQTDQIEGQFTLNYGDPSASQSGLFIADISTLTSDQPRRDEAIRAQWLESARYPLATFVVKEVRGFPPNPQPGQPVTFQLAGEMTIKETRQPVTWDVTATLDFDRLTGTATTFIKLADFGIPTPDIAGVLTVTDGVTLTLDFTFKAFKPTPIPPGGG